MSVYHAHDKFFRESFGRLEIARNYLEEYLPANLLPHLDLSQMSLLGRNLASRRPLSHAKHPDPDLRHQLPRLIDIVFALANQKSGVEYIRTILYYLTRATGKISRSKPATAAPPLPPTQGVSPHETPFFYPTPTLPKEIPL